jgi:hypothetical protein
MGQKMMKLTVLGGLVIAFISGCQSQPVQLPEVVKVPVLMPCIERHLVPIKPTECVPANEKNPIDKLRCLLLDLLRTQKYAQELEIIVTACVKEK